MVTRGVTRKEWQEASLLPSLSPPGPEPRVLITSLSSCVHSINTCVATTLRGKRAGAGEAVGSVRHGSRSPRAPAIMLGREGNGHHSAAR